MHRLKIIILFLNLLCYQLIAQQVYFSNRYNYDYFDTGRSIYVDSNRIVLINISSNFSPLSVAYHFSEIDFNGNIQYTKTYGGGANYYGGGIAFIDRTYDDGFISAGSYEYGSINDALLYRFNSVGDTLWTKRIGDSINFQSGWQAKQTADSGFVICGQTNGDYLLAKTDSLGNLQWQKSYNILNYDLAESVIQTTDGGYMLAGGCCLYFGDEGDGLAIKTDAAGNTQWTAQYGNPQEHDYFTQVIQTKDGGYLLSGTYTDSSLLQGDIPFGRLYLVKLYPNGSLQWEKKYLSTRYNVAITTIKELPDSSIIVCAQNSDTILSAPIGMLLKVNSNGDSLWSRNYEILQGNSSDNMLIDIAPMPDGGFVACGYVVPQLPDTGTQDMWLLRVDSLGCEYAGCDPTFGITPLSWGEGLGVRCYPNPFTHEVYLQTPFTKAEVVVYDVMGKKVFDKKIKQESFLNLQHLLPGLYMVNVTDDKQSFTVKIVKE